MIEKIIKYLSVISLAVFLLGYSFLAGYYSSFHIDIINYISTSEIFYSLLPLVVFLFGSGFSLFNQISTSSKQTTPKAVTEDALQKRKMKIKWLAISVMALSVTGGFINGHHFTYREAPLVQTLTTVLIIIPIVYLSFSAEQLKNFGQLAFYQIIAFALVGYLFLQFGQQKARINRVMGGETKIKFRCHNVFYTTDNKLIYLGETQSTIFLYKNADSVTWILPKANIDSLIIVDKQ